MADDDQGNGNGTQRFTLGMIVVLLATWIVLLATLALLSTARFPADRFTQSEADSLIERRDHEHEEIWAAIQRQLQMIRRNRAEIDSLLDLPRRP